MFRESSFRRLLSSCKLDTIDVVYYSFNILPAPLDSKYPRKSVQIIKKLEHLRIGRLNWLGMAFVIKAKKSDPQKWIEDDKP
jgi:hypothetical protein